MTAVMIRRRLEAVLAYAVLGFFAALPVDWASGLGGFLTRSVGPYLKVSNVARRNLARTFPEKSAAEIETIVTEVWDNLGRVAGEFPHIDWLMHNRVELVGRENLELLRDDGQPGLFVAAHLGNWELAATTAVMQGIPIILVYREANNPWVEKLYRRYRAHAAPGGQIAKGPEGAREIMQALKSGGHVGMLVDQKMNDGITVPFLGREAMTAPAVGRFAVRFKCPVVPARVERLKGAHFRVTICPPLDHTLCGDAHQDTLNLMTVINDQIGAWIRERPGQWLWLHKRWPEN
ncbi:lysophospholipid acyltransferase family protein [Magnetospirillum gryphiswaldense]|uniref:Lipid A biosynthesis (KDO)2-(Lauroyl)-lipid IVA acyltransferase n=1 Tax=Magnetospirillum gryphiswaldense (strain DSM 6361 / JCM 21280 / NBRC 15271 / MSR-1) TaxID=431944 RepID=V6EVZ0_MAGGM|nr:lipid A biosynthesis (KDO)2-(lauroyl)-lipid IVA acyltransferase [Magnetospirillum gryphiswaldense]AVM72666.1 Lipid A biosynthesis (KDO)2-(lauroyl)-lipid IVA acyltransferase [Magnetospirillum gryphiswaldense MSR-1]AVM76569.1 Lipid A biosynthesis (KDO)2-(lauroyl)-lipid IVA acyltransferase [Magnetospirillum gryphiswaldense]CDK97344.1 putative Lipid A biosynthesis (KDO)2-(lauroyl)-lipid IVA acyltransferase [Magnetospirillum gryphiswaldense MSR-1 v2]